MRRVLRGGRWARDPWAIDARGGSVRGVLPVAPGARALRPAPVSRSRRGRERSEARLTMHHRHHHHEHHRAHGGADHPGGGLAVRGDRGHGKKDAPSRPEGQASVHIPGRGRRSGGSGEVGGCGRCPPRRPRATCGGLARERRARRAALRGGGVSAEEAGRCVRGARSALLVGQAVGRIGAGAHAHGAGRALEVLDEGAVRALARADLGSDLAQPPLAVQWNEGRAARIGRDRDGEGAAGLVRVVGAARDGALGETGASRRRSWGPPR